MLASYEDILWARHAMFSLTLRDEPKERLHRRLQKCQPRTLNIGGDQEHTSLIVPYA